MPQLKNRLPKLRLHKASGRAVVTLSGRDVYLGPHGSEEAGRTYARVISEWLERGRCPDAPVPADVRVKHVIANFMRYAKARHRHADGSPKTRLSHIKPTLRQLLDLYGDSSARDFGPRRLKAFRLVLVESGLFRGTVNDRTRIVVDAFRQAVEDELVPAEVHHALKAVRHLRNGDTAAPESQAVRSVASGFVEQVLPYLSRHVAAMTQLAMLTGARPGEICIVRTADIDTSGPVWLYRPTTHKNAHRDQERIIALGPIAQEVLRPFLKPDLEAFIFSPAEAEAERRATCHAARTTPLRHGNRPGTNRRRKPERQPGARYGAGSWRQAIHRACDRAFPPPDGLPDDELAAWREAHRFNPGQLRHTAATKVRGQFGLDAAQVVLGHKNAAVTQIYAERDIQHAVRVALAIG